MRSYCSKVPGLRLFGGQHGVCFSRLWPIVLGCESGRMPAA